MTGSATTGSTATDNTATDNTATDNTATDNTATGTAATDNAATSNSATASAAADSTAPGRAPAGGAGADGTGTSGAAGGPGHSGPRSRTDVIDVAAVDDHPIVLDGIADWVTDTVSGIRVVAVASSVAALLAGPGRDAHVVLLDLDLGNGTTVERNVAEIIVAGPAVLVLAASDKPVSVRAAMRAGAVGYVLKNEQAAQVREAIRAAVTGKDWISPRLAYIFATDDAPDRPELSPQETRALRLYATGMPMKAVARRMNISEETTKQYVGRVREKYARSGRAAPTKLDLYYRAVEDGHLPPLP
jgi:DNA-binding NarL/FixJ family response regulator